MIKWLKQMFCKHKEYKDVPVYLFGNYTVLRFCKKCGKELNNVSHKLDCGYRR